MVIFIVFAVFLQKSDAKTFKNKIHAYSINFKGTHNPSSNQLENRFPSKLVEKSQHEMSLRGGTGGRQSRRSNLP